MRAEVEISIDKDKTIIVKVFSIMRPGLIARWGIPESVHGNSRERARKIVCTVAAERAEYLNDTFGDVFDPSVVSKNMALVYDEMVARIDGKGQTKH